MILTKEQILAKRLPIEAVDVGEGAQILVRALPLHIVQQSQHINSIEYTSDAFIFVHAVVDESGNRLYTDAEIPMIAQTIETSLLNLVVSTSFRLGKIDDVTLERIKKNWQTLGISLSGETPSPSGTPTPI